eukprot:CAMPEP_0202960072 /NCGR_PEP_ID=MMETSP1396-20130829/4241_1 /ASSEMBLY_ACC=CAM_ASM_000872 /TAXON_ID= /ORGANISM="Pseudokeronopsis sp., Strain Brazil" /LENGTH=73 /DNA_ID=CAMNT_0049679053 /DNA_START=299 /DNA_END=517 /DNA_ORIENTATION=+
MTYNSESFNEKYFYGFSLLPGYGCYMTMERTVDGSYGTVTFEFEDTNLVIIDNFQQFVKTGDKLGMVEMAQGW